MSLLEIIGGVVLLIVVPILGFVWHSELMWRKPPKDPRNGI